MERVCREKADRLALIAKGKGAKPRRKRLPEWVPPTSYNKYVPKKRGLRK